MSSTELLEAASNSWMESDPPWSKDKQVGQAPQASPEASRLLQLMVLAKMRAQDVFPTPLGPQNR